MSYYLFDSPSGIAKSFVTFFGDNPRNGITYGTRIVLACAIILLAVLAWLRTKKVLRVIVIVLVSYISFFFLGSLPSFITFAFAQNHYHATHSGVAAFVASPTTILGNQIMQPINAINVKMSLIYFITSIIITLIILFYMHKKTFVALLKNIRPIQTLYHLGLLFIGMGFAFIFADAVVLPSLFSFVAFFLLCIAVIFAWYGNFIFNDCADIEIDRISNKNRPLVKKVITQKNYKHIGITLIILSLVITMAVSPYAVLPLFFYHAFSFLYNTSPLRLKKFPFIATLIAAIASFMIVVVGFVTIAPEHSLAMFPPHIAMLLIVTYTVSLPIKDLKDIAGDKANHIYTIPVLFGERAGRMIIAIGIFLSFMLSIFAFGTRSLLFVALLAGTLSFWTIVGRKENRFLFSPYQTLVITFFIVAIYSVFLVFALIK